MRFRSLAALSAVTLSLAACMAPPPGMAPPPAAPPPVATMPVPGVADAATRQIARDAITQGLEANMQGVDVQPYVNCVMDNATSAELVDIAQASQSGRAATAGSIAAIVRRDPTKQCMASVARTI
ncbi:hypothetical protein [Paracoccus sp. (in: a-proteobacteria)]|uniref:hypothetical protein n=1 Tax=Paracoccus sp. TaxID=267 RepID=UPI003A8894AE